MKNLRELDEDDGIESPGVIESLATVAVLLALAGLLFLVGSWVWSVL